MSENSLPGVSGKFTFSAEFRLLTACSWIAPPLLEQEQLDTVSSLCCEEIDWDIFLSLVRRHGIPALAYKVLSCNAGKLPAKVMGSLKSLYIQASGLALRHMQETALIGTLFSSHGIEMMLMKGEILSARLYGDPVLRSSSDIDMMVKTEDFDRADQLILSMGYRCYFPGDNCTRTQRNYHRSVGQNFEYYHEKKGIKLELHWRSYLWNQSQTNDLWAHFRLIDLMDKTYRFWNDDTLILFLCYHGAHHEWCSLKWLSDVAVLFSSDRPDGWEKLFELARQMGMDRVLAQSALLVSWVYGVTLPPLFCELIRNDESAVVSLSGKAVTSLLQTSESLASVGKRMDGIWHSWYLMRLFPSITLNELFKKVGISFDDVKVLTLPDKLFWLYLPLRPVLWFWRNYIRK